MGYLIPVAEFGHYLLFSILMGKVVLQFVPESNKPKIEVSKTLYLLCCLGIIFFTFMPILQVVLFFKESVGLIEATISVLRDFQIGRAWMAISIFALLLWIFIYFERDKFLQAICLILMVLAVGSASHVASLSFQPGLYFHTVHFLMVTIWVGVLIHVAWFSKGTNNWLGFLKWFTPLASICLLVVFVSGFFLMSYVDPINEYVNGWAVPYGRMLLIKHIAIVPVIVFAFINGVLAKKSVLRLDFDARPWVKGESIVLLLVFYCTAVVGTLSPPHEVDLVQATEQGPTWEKWLLTNYQPADWQVEFLPTPSSFILIMISFLFLALMIISFKKTRPILAGVLAVSFILTSYLGVMFSVVLKM
jgi:copper resistance protein D